MRISIIGVMGFISSSGTRKGNAVVVDELEDVEELVDVEVLVVDVDVLVVEEVDVLVDVVVLVLVLLEVEVEVDVLELVVEVVEVVLLVVEVVDVVELVVLVVDEVLEVVVVVEDVDDVEVVVVEDEDVLVVVVLLDVVVELEVVLLVEVVLEVVELVEVVLLVVDVVELVVEEEVEVLVLVDDEEVVVEDDDVVVATSGANEAIIHPSRTVGKNVKTSDCEPDATVAVECPNVNPWSLLWSLVVFVLAIPPTPSSSMTAPTSIESELTTVVVKVTVACSVVSAPVAELSGTLDCRAPVKEEHAAPTFPLLTPTERVFAPDAGLIK